jgi:hypothetical protein
MGKGQIPMNGKGSKSRPFSVPVEVFGDRFDTIFRKKDKKQLHSTSKVPTITHNLKKQK